MKLILLGPPGSGKGTISERLAKEYSLFHLSPGELLREEVKKGTTLGKEIKKFIENGDLVPNQFVVELVRLEIDGHKSYILDGFPRTIDQAQAIKDLPLDAVIFLDITEKEVITRFAGRRMCLHNHGYHLTVLPPKKAGICDLDGLPLLKRKDDEPKVIKERFRIYNKETAPLVEYYRKKKLLKKVNASLAPEEVYKEVKRVLKKR